MNNTRTSVLSTRVDADLAKQIDNLARAEGISASRFLERVIRQAVVQMDYHGPAGTAKLNLIDEANIRNGKIQSHEHPGVSIWELDENIWPRHFLHVQCEFDLTGLGGSSEVWLLWKGEEVEQIEPDAYLKRHAKNGGAE